jgi:hypothetical protein
VARGAATASSSGASSIPLAPPDPRPHAVGSILRAFLIEEAKIVKKVIKSQQGGK